MRLLRCSSALGPIHTAQPTMSPAVNTRANRQKQKRMIAGGRPR